MVKILFLSDTHLGFDYPTRPGKTERRGQDFFDNFEYILKYALENEVDLVLHGGDFFFRTRIPNTVVNKSYRILYDFSTYNIPLVIVPGNHESSRLPRSPLIFQPNIHIFKEPSTFSFEIKGRRINVSGFPYERKQARDQFPVIIKQIQLNEKQADINLLLMHHAVEGCRCGPGNYTFRKNEDVLQLKDIPMHYDAVLCGHIHREQILWKEEKGKKLPIIYTGSIERTSFAEKEETKGFSVFEFDDDKQNQQFIPLKTRPMVDINIADQPFTSDELRDYLQRQSEKLDERSIVRIKCQNDQNRKMLSQVFLKDCFPPSMIIQLSGWAKEFIQRKKKDRTPGLFDF